MSEKIQKNYCIQCERETNHKVLHEDIEQHREGYSEDVAYQIVQCRGCDFKSFRTVTYDIEQAYPDYSTGDEEWIIPEYVETYPKSILWHKELEVSHIPQVVNDIYNEVLNSIKEEAFILSSLGLRGVLESICNDLNIKGKNLEVRINKLAQDGFISKKDSERLHGIRFMGNDAAHDIKKPKIDNIKVALSIVENLMYSVYTLEKRAKGCLETAISDYNEFEKLIDNALERYPIGEELPIAQFIGENARRINSALSTLEKQLIDKISNGIYTKLKIGKTTHKKNSQDKLQHYIKA